MTDKFDSEFAFLCCEEEINVLEAQLGLQEAKIKKLVADVRRYLEALKST